MSTVPAPIMAKVSRRLLPFLFLLFLVNFLDRVNVGFAALQMNQQLGFSPQVFGFGAGIFFLGYTVLEVPSNIVLRRVGARLWLSRISLSWGLVAMATALVQGPLSFYVLRFLLGVAEAGFVPGLLYYLTLWYPPEQRAQAIARVWLATAAAIVLGSPLSAALMTLDGVLGLPGWKWIFLIEGAPAVLLGILGFRVLTNSPETAAWLEPEERTALAASLTAGQGQAASHKVSGLVAGLRSPMVWSLSLVFFCMGIGFFGVTIWLPQIVKQLSGLSNIEVSLVTTIPFAFAAAGMVLNARHSDRTGERRWHLVIPLLVGAIGLGGSALVPEPLSAFALLCLAAAGLWSAIGVFWALPANLLTGAAAAAGLALINAIGGISGFVAPYGIGLLRGITPSFSAALLCMSASLMAAAVLAALLGRQQSALLSNSEQKVA
ncbi:MFS transporter [Rhizobium rhizogenes]|uniref:MFS transporter n=1 Tax=Rhizobium rhizogenes TaxID=359 RepID=UPI001F24C4E1|nr:MFS transporter [Rhizobium rhizogenes]